MRPESVRHNSIVYRVGTWKNIQGIQDYWFIIPYFSGVAIEELIEMEP